MLDVSVEFDLGNRQLIIHGVHVQCRVLGDRLWDMRGLLGRLLQLLQEPDDDDAF